MTATDTSNSVVAVKFVFIKVLVMIIRNDIKDLIMRRFPPHRRLDDVNCCGLADILDLGKTSTVVCVCVGERDFPIIVATRI